MLERSGILQRIIDAVRDLSYYQRVVKPDIEEANRLRAEARAMLNKDERDLSVFLEAAKDEISES